MQLYRRADESANRILELFKSVNLPKALAPVFVKRQDGSPCRAWSWSNQLLVALAGHTDARGYRQWEQVGRHVVKGQKSTCHILVPITRKFTETGDDGAERERVAVLGFTTTPVFGVDQTDGAELPDDTARECAWLDSLPVIDVARRWSIDVQTYNATDKSRYQGYYRTDGQIALGVRNLATWAHELCHAADHRLQGTFNGGQHLDQETVAELGGAVLLHALGYETDADVGGACQYISGYAHKHNTEPIRVCVKLLNRVCEAVNLILQTAAEIAAEPKAQVA